MYSSLWWEDGARFIQRREKQFEVHAKGIVKVMDEGLTLIMFITQLFEIVAINLIIQL